MSVTTAPDVTGISDRWGGNPGQWRRFFCQKEFDQMFFWTNSGGFKGRILYVVHGALECTFYPPDLTYRGMTFLNYPTLFPHDPASPGPATLYEQVATDMKEADVVLGRCRGLDDVAVELRRRAGKLDLVMVSWACLPTIIGDDEAAVIDSWRKAAGCPILVNSIQFRMGRSFSLHEKLLEEWRKRPGFLEVARDPSAVNLWGCAPAHFREELGPVLDLLGIKVNMRLLPEIDIAALDRTMAAACQVVPERLLRFETVARMLDGLPMPTVRAPAPYGQAGSRDYARAIAAAFGREGAFDEAWASVSGPARPRVRGERLAFVVDEASVRTLLDPLGQTLPVLRMVCEMGFGLDFLVYAPGDELQRLAREIAAFPGMTENPGFEGFADRAELAELLREGSFRAVYSDVRNDERLTRAGKAQFSMRMFEPGLAGAARTLERLLGACRLTFYERYGRYLGGPDE